MSSLPEALYAEIGRRVLADGYLKVALLHDGVLVEASRGFLALLGAEPGRLPALEEVFAEQPDWRADHPGTVLVATRQGERLALRLQPLGQGGTLVFARDVGQDYEPDHPLVRLAYTDPVTGLANRAELQRRLPEVVAAATANHRRCALLVADLDGFKAVNDIFGHQVGDAALVAVAARISRCARRSDLVARLGGDEFVVLVPAIEREADATALADRIVRALDETIEARRVRVMLGISVGIAIFPDDAADADTLFYRADEAMYAAKAAGKHRVSSARRSGATRLRPIRAEVLGQVGVPQVDAEHSALLATMNDFRVEVARGCDGTRMRSMLHALVGRVKEHFASEEVLMARAGDAGLPEHRGDHERALEDLLALTMTADAGSAVLTMRYLEEWLIAHIERHDQPMGRRMGAE